jgi:hypothetical protein
MRPLRYAINITLDGCGDHEAAIPDEALHHHAARVLRGPTLFAGLSRPLDLTLVGRQELTSGAVVLRYERRR